MTDRIAASFTEAMLDIFKENSIAVDGTVSVDAETDKLQVVSTMGLSGDLRGNIIFGLTFESARSIVESLFKANNLTSEEKEFGDLEKAAVGEFANQITGRALMALSREAIDCTMSPPTVITGDVVVPTLGPCAEAEYVSRVKGGFGSAVLRVGINERKKE